MVLVRRVGEAAAGPARTSRPRLLGWLILHPDVRARIEDTDSSMAVGEGLDEAYSGTERQEQSRRPLPRGLERPASSRRHRLRRASGHLGSDLAATRAGTCFDMANRAR